MNNNEALIAARNSILTFGRNFKKILGRIMFGYCPVTAPTAPANDAEVKRVEQPEPEVIVSPVPEEEPAPKVAPPNLKVCSRCRVRKPLDTEHFHRDAHKISGFRSACRECSSTTVKQVRCKGCGVSKPLTAQFWQRNSRAKSGFRSSCRACQKKTTSA